MQIDIPILISFLSLCVAAFVAMSNIKNNKSAEDRKETSEMTTLIVKLENINNGVNEIKSDLRNLKDDVQDLRDRLIIVEQSTKNAHQRLDALDKGE